MPASRALIFVDSHCTAPYHDATLSALRLEAAEAGIVRLAEALAADRPVRVLQRGRRAAERRGGVTYEALDAAALAREPALGAVVVRDSWRLALHLRALGVAAPVAVWMHRVPDRSDGLLGVALAAAEARLIAVSRTRAETILGFLERRCAPLPQIEILPDPLPDGLRPDHTLRDPNLLLFAAGPHEGLVAALDTFASLRARLPALRLAIADPGYLGMGTDPNLPGVIWLGHLPQPRLRDWMRRALCLFQPGTAAGEAAGLAVAEANAVGTPALLDRRVAGNAELVADPGQLVDVDNIAAIEARIRAWQVHPPLTAANPRRRLAAVTAAWRCLLLDMEAPQSPGQPLLPGRAPLERF